MTYLKYLASRRTLARSHTYLILKVRLPNDKYFKIENREQHRQIENREQHRQAARKTVFNSNVIYNIDHRVPPFTPQLHLSLRAHIDEELVRTWHFNSLVVMVIIYFGFCDFFFLSLSPLFEFFLHKELIRRTHLQQTHGGEQIVSYLVYMFEEVRTSLFFVFVLVNGNN